jgi:hypothetical protein
MAGSYNHILAHDEDGNRTDGSLAPRNEVLEMLETRSGDVYEAVEEMYGMIWVLATDLAEEIHGTNVDPKELVEHAQETYKNGLALSPTSRFQEE